MTKDNLGQGGQVFRGGDRRGEVGDPEHGAQALDPYGLRDRARKPHEEPSGEALHKSGPDILQTLLDPAGQHSLEETPVMTLQSDLGVMHNGIPAFHRSSSGPLSRSLGARGRAEGPHPCLLSFPRSPG